MPHLFHYKILAQHEIYCRVIDSTQARNLGFIFFHNKKKCKSKYYQIRFHIVQLKEPKHIIVYRIVTPFFVCKKFLKKKKGTEGMRVGP